MLWWEKFGNVYEGYQGERAVAQIRLEPPYGFCWSDDVGGRFGACKTLTDAKSAAGTAFTAWLQSADLVHLPDGYQFAIQGLQDAIIFYDRVQSATQDERTAVGQDHWNRLEAAARKVAMLAAANKRGDSPYAPGHPKNITGEGVDGDSVATTGRGAAANTAQDGREDDG